MKKQGHLRVIEGHKGRFEVQRKKLGEKAVVVAEQWGKKQIGAKGERKLLNAFQLLCPGIAESILRIAAPVMLAEVGQRAVDGELDEEGTNFLAHIFSFVATGKAQLVTCVIEDLDQIRADLSLISTDWIMEVDPNGNYIDIVGRPVMPTGLDLSTEETPAYEEINVATVYLEEPKSELTLDAKFICLAPRRIKFLLDELDKARAKKSR